MIIFLTVLKWIGIVLLCLIGLVILLFLLFMFFPFVYRIKAEKFDEFKASVSLSFFFRFLYLVLSYHDKKPLFKAYILGIPVYKTDFQFLLDAIKEYSASQTTKAEDMTEESTAEQSTSVVEDTIADSTEESAESDEPADKTDAEIDEEIKAIMEEEEPKRGLVEEIRIIFEKIKQFISNLKNKCYNIYDSFLQKKKQLEKILRNIKYYYKVVNHPAVKAVWELILKQIKKIWRNVRPRKIRIWTRYGASDPAQTGKVYGYYCMIYPFYGKSIQMEPDLENEVFLLKVFIRGRFQVYRFMLSGLTIVLNRNCRKIVRLLRREGKKRGR